MKKYSTAGSSGMREQKFSNRGNLIAALLMLYDAFAVNIAYFAALWLRFDGSFKSIPSEYMLYLGQYTPIHIAVTLGLFLYLGLYRSLWRYASFSEFARVVLGVLISATVMPCVTVAIGHRLPISVYLMGCILEFILVVFIRFAYRGLRIVHQKNEKGAILHHVMVIGAGDAGRLVIHEFASSKWLHSKIVCAIDDDPYLRGKSINGVPIVGNREEILRAVQDYDVDKIVLAIPTATAVQKREILSICKETDCELKIVPGLYQLVNGEVAVSKLRPVSIEDLLGREQIKVNLNEIARYVTGKVILVTGGGGSIGSELCRQIAKHHPKQLIIFDIYENNAYDIQQELKRSLPELNLTVLIGSVRDVPRLEQIFELYHPDIVYHAAAHKHVPLMEDSPCETVKNNVLGTYYTAKMAAKYGTQRFVLISTDKAVNPTNIMGASKRLCEMIIQTMNKVTHQGLATMDGKPLDVPDRPPCEYVAVRFGNVLGSNGSVIPLFKKQIEEGGPVTVTDPEIIRYFMTIPEAVSLVLQAGAYAKGGEIFVLDMGTPVKIDDLARNLIRLSGYTPDVDITIVYTGLRPGEKLFEEKLMAEEGLQKTENDLIFIGQPMNFDAATLLGELRSLKESAYSNDAHIKEKVARIVKTYQLNKSSFSRDS